MPPKTMFEKIWDAHVVHEEPGEPAIIYIDLHLVHEVTSPQAFRRSANGRPKGATHRPDHRHRRPQHSHLGPLTACYGRNLQSPAWTPWTATARSSALRCTTASVDLQGIVHIIGPDLGYTQPGKTVVCGDSHTSTHGALGAFAVGIGTSEVEHVLATQTLRQFKPRTMEVRVDGQLAARGLPARTSFSGSSGASV